MKNLEAKKPNLEKLVQAIIAIELHEENGLLEYAILQSRFTQKEIERAHQIAESRQ